ncbi:unnamed protein product, partial [Nesidiocoris tenuis]
RIRRRFILTMAHIAMYFGSKSILVSCVILVISSRAASQRLLENPTKDSNARTRYTKIFGASAIRRLIENNGYGYENYTVTTEDGYILNLNRIVNPIVKNGNRGYPLLLLNGYLMHSEAWLIQERADTNIAAVWAGLGYDVWLGDQRGTMRSRRHVNLTTDDKKYWDFSYFCKILRRTYTTLPILQSEQQVYQKLKTI